MDGIPLHRLLETDPKEGEFKRNVENPLACQLLVVDETSMVDTPLVSAMLKALPPNAALLVVGDVDQLPSVGAQGRDRQWCNVLRHARNSRRCELISKSS